MVLHYGVPSMGVLRGKCKPSSPVLGVIYQPDSLSPETEFCPFAVAALVDIERPRQRAQPGKSTAAPGPRGHPRYILRDTEIVWPVGAKTAHTLMRAGGTTRLAGPNGSGWYTGLALALPDVTYTEHCLGLACRDCHLWDPCLDGGLPFGWFVHVTVEAYHMARRFDVSAENPSKPVFQLGDRTETLTVHGAARPREILSFNKDLYLPQTWKTASERAAEEYDPHDEEE